MLKFITAEYPYRPVPFIALALAASNLDLFNKLWVIDVDLVRVDADNWT
jgi:hypothetical protein